MEELEGIVQRMIDAGEPEENIKLVIEEFTSREKNKEVDLGKPEAVQDAAPVTAEVEAAGTELALENGSLDSQSEVESKLIKNPNVGDEGEFVKAYDPYNDFNNIMPLSFSKVNPEKLTEMYNTKSKDLEITTKELESTANTLREQSDYIKEESNRISNSQYSNEEERKAESDQEDADAAALEEKEKAKEEAWAAKQAAASAAAQHEEL